jgi:hypothetical protein
MTAETAQPIDFQEERIRTFYWNFSVNGPIAGCKHILKTLGAA